MYIEMYVKLEKKIFETVELYKEYNNLHLNSIQV